MRLGKGRVIMTVDEFLSLEKPEEYDFTEDWGNSLNQKQKESLREYRTLEPWNKYFEYVRNDAIKDPDTNSMLLQEIYKNLWKDDEILGCCRKSEKARISGETMNSVNVTLNSLFADFIESPNDLRKFREGRQRVSKKYISGLYFDNFKEKQDKFKSYFKEYEHIEKYLSTYHTLGNFIPVPVGCNAPRGKSVVKDYWDLTLACIYNFYAEKENRKDRIYKMVNGFEMEYSIGMMFSGDEPFEKNIKLYMKYLNLFKTWSGFVEQNYLTNNFVNGVSGRPKELWEGHFSGKILPETEEQYNNFFKNATTYINARTGVMSTNIK